MSSTQPEMPSISYAQIARFMNDQGATSIRVKLSSRGLRVTITHPTYSISRYISLDNADHDPQLSLIPEDGGNPDDYKEASRSHGTIGIDPLA